MTLLLELDLRPATGYLQRRRHPHCAVCLFIGQAKQWLVCAAPRRHRQKREVEGAGGSIHGLPASFGAGIQ